MAQTFTVPLDGNDALTKTVSDTSTALATLRSSFSGGSAPSDPAAVAGQLWFDTAATSPKQHDGTTFRPLGGRLLVDTTEVGNVGTGEDDLISETLAANTLSANGQAIRITAWGTLANNANAKSASLYLGATLLGGFAGVTDANLAWRMEALVVRTGASSQKATTLVTYGAVSATAGSAPAADLTGAVTIKATGEGTSDDDVVCEGMLVELVW